MEIYSIGDSAYLAQILNAIAAITGSGDFGGLIKLGLILGVLMLVLTGMSKQQIDIGGFAIGCLLIAISFGPSTTVHIEDAYTGQVRTVDNVPFGPAVVGGALSQVGYGITRIMETGFSVPAMTSTGFADALQALVSVRVAMLSRAGLGDATDGGDMEGSFTNYVADCVLADVDIGKRTIDDVMGAEDFSTAFASANVYYTTVIDLGSGQQALRCDQAWQALRQHMQGNIQPAIERSLQSRMGLSDVNAVRTRIDSAIGTLGLSGRDAQTYMLMSASEGWFYRGIAQEHSNNLHFARATSIEQAVQQRNTQWATEQQLFMRFVRPFLTFMEGFLYAITPLMAFAMAFGAAGVKLVGKWLLMAFWIQLWMPVLAIINLYILMAAGRDLAALESVEGLPFLSLYGLQQADTILQDYLATGGMLAAATPAIALMLVYGSAITATHLAGRLQSGDHADETQLSPAVSKVSPGHQVSPRFDTTSYGGTARYESQSQVPSFDFSKDAQQRVSATEAALQQSSRSFMSSLGSAVSRSVGQGRSSMEQWGTGTSWQASQSQTDRTLYAHAQSLNQSFENSSLTNDQMAAALAGGIAAAAGGRGKAGIAGDVSGRLQQVYKTDQMEADKVGQAIAEKVTSDQAMATELANSVSTDARNQVSSALTSELSSDDRSQLQDQAQDVVQDARSHERAQSEALVNAGRGSYNSRDVGRMVSNDAALMQRGLATIDRLGLTGAHQRLTSWYASTHGFADRDQASAAAMVHTLSGYDSRAVANLSGQQQRSARDTAFDIVSQAFHAPAAMGIDPDASAGLQGASGGYGSTRDAVSAGLGSDPRSAAAGLGDRFDTSWQANPAQRWADPQGRIHDAHGAMRQGVHDQGSAWHRQMAQQRQDRAMSAIQDRVANESAAATVAHRLGGQLATGMDLAERATDGVGAAASGAWAGAQRFASRLQDGADISDAWAAAGDGFRERAGPVFEQIANAHLSQMDADALTDAQQDYFLARAGGISALTSNMTLGVVEPNTPRERAAYDRLVAEHGDDAPAIAELLTRSAQSMDTGILAPLKEYNRAGEALGRAPGPVGGDDGLVHPLSQHQTINSGFGMRSHPIDGVRKMHSGVDLPAPTGTEVRAMAPGHVYTSKAGGYGNLATMQHTDPNLGFDETRYAHLSRFAVDNGTYVDAGGVIGYVGSTGRSTGPHLHLETRKDGEALDPRRFLGG